MPLELGFVCKDWTLKLLFTLWFSALEHGARWHLGAFPCISHTILFNYFETTLQKIDMDMENQPLHTISRSFVSSRKHMGCPCRIECWFAGGYPVSTIQTIRGILQIFIPTPFFQVESHLIHWIFNFQLESPIPPSSDHLPGEKDVPKGSHQNFPSRHRPFVHWPPPAKRSRWGPWLSKRLTGTTVGYDACVMVMKGP